MLELSDREKDIFRDFFSYPKHNCPSCTCQCAIISRDKKLSSKVTILAEKGNKWLVRFNAENVQCWLPKIIAENYLDIMKHGL